MYSFLPLDVARAVVAAQFDGEPRVTDRATDARFWRSWRAARRARR